MNQLIKKVEDVEAEVKPEIYADYKQMKADIRQQRHDREQLLKQIDNLKKQTEVQREKAQVCENRVTEMETQVGMIAHTDCYAEGFELPKNENVSLQALGDSFLPKNSTISSQRLNVKSSHDDLQKSHKSQA